MLATLRYISDFAKGGIATAKQHYSDYVDHILRFYARSDENRNRWRHGQTVTFRTGLDLKNWAACDMVISSMPPNDSALILYIYKQTGPMNDAVVKTAEVFEVSQNALWGLINTTGRDIALQAGIIQSVTPGSSVTTTNKHKQ